MHRFDLDAVRRFLAPDVVFKMASPWTDEPWRIFFPSADAVIERLKAPMDAMLKLGSGVPWREARGRNWHRIGMDRRGLAEQGGLV